MLTPAAAISILFIGFALGFSVGILIGLIIGAGSRADYERQNATMLHAIRQVLIEATEQHDDTFQITEATFHRLLKINADAA